MLLIVILTAIFGLMFLFIWYGFRDDRAKRKEQSKKLEEDGEFLYDKYTGKKITIEEAEAGVNVSTDDLRRIKSEEELANIYSGTDLEMRLVINDFQQKGYQVSDQPLDFQELIGDSAILSNALQWSWAEEDIFELSPVNFLIISYVLYPNSQGNWVTILVIETEEKRGHFVATKITELEQLLTRKTDETIIETTGYEIRTIRRGNGEQTFIKMIETIALPSYTTVEIMDNLVLVFSDFTPSTERLDEITSLYENLLRYRPLRAKSPAH